MELELNDDFRELLSTLNSNNVRYLLIGGYAVIIHGAPRLTNDLDIVIASDSENAERCLNALRDFGFTEGLSEKAFAKRKSVVRMGIEPVKIEILNYLEGVDFESAYKRREIRTVEDIEFSLISLQDLLANKRTVARDKDLIDVKELIRVNPEAATEFGES